MNDARQHEWVGQTVGEVLDTCGVDFAEVELIDEPPGKLRQLAFECEKEGRTVLLVLTLAYDSSLFSMERRWDAAAVRARRITAIEEERPDGEGHE